MAKKIGEDPELSARLQKAGDDLKELEGRIKTGMIDLRVLAEFREAMNHARHTAFAVQKWAQEEQKAGGNPYSIMEAVMTERMRVATQLCKDLLTDIQRGDIDYDTPGTMELYKQIQSLEEHLGQFLRQK